MIIDSHCHLQKRPGFLGEMVEAYTRAGVDRAVVCNGGARFDQPDNDDVLAAHQRCPKFIIPFAFIVPGEDRAERVDEFHARGFRGLKLQNPRVNYDDRAAYPIYERAQALGMPILFHTGIGGRFPRDAEFDVDNERHRPIRLDRIARAFPELKIIGAHLGLPWVWEASFVALFNPNVWFDLAGIDRSDKHMPGLLNYKELFWAGDRHHRKIVFGTEGAPEHIGWVKKEYEDLFERLRVSSETRALIMGGTVARMLGLGS
ncbi:MAG: amidohydrolase family protein [Verrucomicrobia bacterium]|nr:amidohydrolase family protein [Verrucomicrobiota bacterium]